MMTHRSINNSEVRVRTKPALRLCQRDFQKNVVAFLEKIRIPEVLESRIRSNAKAVVSSKIFYAWKRPAQLRSNLLYLEEGKPIAMIQWPNKEKAWTIRIPINHRQLAAVGPVVCECFWDPIDHNLTLCDVVYYHKELVWQTESFSSRYELLNSIKEGIMQNTNEYSDCTVEIPAYCSMDAAAGWAEDEAWSFSLQPEDAGCRRFRHGVDQARRPREDRQDRRQERQKSQPTLQIQSESEDEVQAPPQQQKIKQLIPSPPPIVKKKESAGIEYGNIDCILRLDTKNPMPDVYKLTSMTTGADLGIAAIRSLDLSLKIRTALQGAEQLRVKTAWYEPFKKYEITQL